MSRMTTAMDEADRMIVEAANEMTRARRRLAFIALSLLGVAGMSVVAAYLMRERTVHIIAPEGESIRLEIERERVRIPSGKGVVTRLRPGSYAMTVEGAANPRPTLRVSPLDLGTVFVPVSEDQCFVEATAVAMYGPNPSPPTVLRVTKPGESVSTGLFHDDVVVEDICALPRSRHLMTNVHVVQPIHCSARPQTTKEAGGQLLLRYALCSVGAPQSN
jgi:hypothetical protein